ncbi:MAG: hypothetical protein ACYDAB_02725 [bacterium]
MRVEGIQLYVDSCAATAKNRELQLHPLLVRHLARLVRARSVNVGERSAPAARIDRTRGGREDGRERGRIRITKAGQVQFESVGAVPLTSAYGLHRRADVVGVDDADYERPAQVRCPIRTPLVEELDRITALEVEAMILLQFVAVQLDA